MLSLVERHPAGFAFAFRSLYGFRFISPIAIGTTRISHRLFLLLNAIAALVWTSIFSTLGYAFGGSAYLISLCWPLDVGGTMIIGGGAIGLTLAGSRFFHRSKAGDHSSRPPSLSQGTA